MVLAACKGLAFTFCKPRQVLTMWIQAVVEDSTAVLHNLPAVLHRLPAVLHRLLTIRFGVGLSAKKLQCRAGATEKKW